MNIRDYLIWHLDTNYSNGTTHFIVGFQYHAGQNVIGQDFLQHLLLFFDS